MQANRKSFPPEIKATIKALYESGAFPSIDLLQKHCKKTMLRAPSRSRIEKWAVDENWDKKKSEPEIAEKKRKNYADLFAELGVDEQKRAELIVEGLNAYGDLSQKLLKFFEDIGIDLPDEVKEQLKKLTPDLNVRHKYLGTLFELTGEFAAKKTKVEASVKDTTPKRRLDDMDEEDIAREVARLNKLHAAALANGSE